MRVAARAIARYVVEHEDASRGICIGYDTRFLSQHFAQIVAEVAAAAGIPVRLADRITPTPALSYAVKHLRAAGGVMITSSHNPYQWNGVKFKASYGGSGSPAIMAAIEGYLGQEAPLAAHSAAITEADFLSPYVEAISVFADLQADRRRGAKICHRLYVWRGKRRALGNFHRAWASTTWRSARS